MQKIIITAIDSKTGTGDKGPWTKTTITGVDGLKASGFDPGLTSLKPGMTIEAEIEVKGKFTNIGKFTVISQGPPPTTESKPATAPPNGRPTYGRGPEERASIERQTALKELGEMIRSGKLGKGEDSWLLTWENLVTQMITQLVPNPFDLSTNEKKDKGTLETVPDFKTPGEFGTYWTKHGFSLLDIQGTFNIWNLADIKDLKAASETLAKIKAARDTQKPKTEG